MTEITLLINDDGSMSVGQADVNQAEEQNEYADLKPVQSIDEALEFIRQMVDAVSMSGGAMTASDGVSDMPVDETADEETAMADSFRAGPTGR